MTNKKFFFITICWNNLEGLQRSVDSLLAQSYTNWECVIIDGDSKDGTKSYLESLLAQHSNIKGVSEPDKGIYDAMNKGLERMTECDYFCFLNSGDALFEGNTLDLLNQRLNLEGVKDPSIVYGHTCEFFADGKENIKRANTNIDLGKGMFCHHQSMFFHYRYAALRYDVGYKLSADYDYIVRAVKNLEEQTDMLLLDMVISRFDMTGASNTQRLDGIKEDFRLRVKNDLCSPLGSAVSAARSICLMGLKRFSYPLYMWMRRA